jgi:hypothetical protein
VFALTAATIAPAYASDSRIQELFAKEMPEYKNIPEAEFKESTYRQTDIPFGDKALAYNIRLPKGWKEPNSRSLSNYNLSTHLLGTIAEFYSPPRLETLRSRFQIQALRLEYELTAEQWLLQHILGNGYTLEGLKFYNKDKVGSLYIYLKDGETFVVRSIAQINGKRMILAQYIVPAAQWNKEAAIIAQSLETFELLNPDDAQIETLHDHLVLDIAQFSYPASWKLDTPPVKTVDRLSSTISNYNKRQKTILDGRIHLDLISAYVFDDLTEEFNKIKLDFRNKGLVIGDLIRTDEDYDFQNNIEFGFIDIYEATDTQNKSMGYEVWIGVATIDNYYSFITLMTPARDDDFFTWSRNVSAFNTVLQSLRLQESDMVMDATGSAVTPR